MTRDEMCETLTLLKALFPSWTQAPSTGAEMLAMADSWLWIGFDELPTPVVHKAMRTLAAGGRPFVPAAGELYFRCAQEIDRDADGGLPSCDEAFGEVADAIQYRGLMEGPPPRWSHPVIGDAVRAFGWRDLCLSENPVATRAHFARTWQTLTDRYNRTLVSNPTMLAELSRMRDNRLDELDYSDEPDEE